MIDRISIIGLKLLRIVTTVLVVSLIGISLYNIFDMHSVQQGTFLSNDLKQYRPAVEKGAKPDLKAITKKNKDVCSWLTLYKTKINYPTPQGKNDLEYVNKDVFGRTTPAGSIYLAAKNAKDFSDNYNLMYGHNVEGGSMFGDITKYKYNKFFNKHRNGVLILPGKVYDIKIFAILETNAYDSMIYNVGGDRNLDQLLGYVKNNAEIYKPPVKKYKILAFSTCDYSRTNGRIVLFGELLNHAGGFEDIGEDDIPLTTGHQNNYWAFINLLCLIAVIYLFFPLHILKTKVKRFEEDEKKNNTKMMIGFLCEGLLAGLALIIFIFTEDIRMPIQMIDKWTPLMLLILIICYFIDIFLLRIELQNRKLSQKNIEKNKKISYN